MANTASPSIPVHKMSATLTLIARSWDQIGTIVPADKATTGMATCAYQSTPAKSTSETVLRSPRCANMMGQDSLTVSVRNITMALYPAWGAVWPISANLTTPVTGTPTAPPSHQARPNALARKVTWVMAQGVMETSWNDSEN